MECLCEETFSKLPEEKKLLTELDQRHTRGKYHIKNAKFKGVIDK